MTPSNEMLELIERAKKETNKGRLYVYEQYKQELQALNLSPKDYEYGCRMIAKHLKV